MAEAVTLEKGVTSCQRRDIERLRITEGGVEACTFRYAEPACSNKRRAHYLKNFYLSPPLPRTPGEFTRSKSRTVTKNRFLRSTHLNSLIGGS